MNAPADANASRGNICVVWGWVAAFVWSGWLVLAAVVTRVESGTCACADEYLLFELTHRLGQRRHPPGIRHDGREQEEAKPREHCCRPLGPMDLVAPWPYIYTLDLGLAACGVVGGTYAKTVLIWLELRENLLISSLPTKYGVKTPRISPNVLYPLV